jgi:hypothetical protein
MGPLAVVSLPPVLDFAPRVVERHEHMLVEAFLTQAAVKGFDERVLNRLAGFNELQPDVAVASPLVKHRLVNSGPLSTWIAVARPRVIRSRSSTLFTRSPVSDTSTSITRLSRLHSSITARAPYRLPLERLS